MTDFNDTFDLHALVADCLAGDQAAMVRLVERFHAPVFAYCYRVLGQRQDAEDVAQETFVRAFRHLASWDSERRFEPWLLTIAANRCRTHLSTRQRRPVAERLDDLVDPAHARRHDLAEEIQHALRKLRPEHREAFVLFHQHELSHDEIARVMSCPVNTAKTWVHRARRELLDALRARDALGGSQHALR